MRIVSFRVPDNQFKDIVVSYYGGPLVVGGLISLFGGDEFMLFHNKIYKIAILCIIILSLLNLCSCKDIEPNLHIFSEIEECGDEGTVLLSPNYNQLYKEVFSSL